MQTANVTICTPFRDSEAHIQPYFDRLAALDYPDHARRYVFVEGDSKDETARWLQCWAQNDNRMKLIKCDTGKPKYGSVINAERFATLAQVFNAALDAVDLVWSDYVLFLPCDIAYSPDLLNRLLAHSKDIIAPAVWVWNGDRHVFYDTWGHTKDRKSVGHLTSYEYAARYGSAPIQMDTVGGTVLIRADVLRAGVRYSPEHVDRGLCRAAHLEGFTVWADPSTNVFHPPFAPGVEVQPQRLAEIAQGEPDKVRADIKQEYGFDPGDRYATDLIAFVDMMTKQVQR